MASFAVVTSALVVRTVIEFFGPENPEPADEAKAVEIVKAWNDNVGNPLGLQAGEIIVRTGKAGYKGRYAGIGYSWNPAMGQFIAPKPYPSWNLDSVKGDWVPPTVEPKDGKPYNWDEQSLSWKLDTNTVNAEKLTP
jgi:hypothetical protein